MARRSAPSILSLVARPDRRDVPSAELVPAAISGATWAQAEIWTRFAPVVFGMAVRTLGSQSDAEDVMQETLYRVLAKIDALRDPDALHPFVVSFAIRVLKWELRRRKARAWLSLHEPERLSDFAFATPDFESRDLLRRFYQQLSRLQPQDQLVFALRRMQSMTVDQIAEVMRVSTPTVKRAYGRAAKRMENWIQMEGQRSGLLGTKRVDDGTEPE